MKNIIQFYIIGKNKIYENQVKIYFFYNTIYFTTLWQTIQQFRVKIYAFFLRFNLKFKNLSINLIFKLNANNFLIYLYWNSEEYTKDLRLDIINIATVCACALCIRML